MALIDCPQCGKSISDKAAVCPNCGCNIDETSHNSKSNDKILPKPLKRGLSIYAAALLVNQLFASGIYGFRTDALPTFIACGLILAGTLLTKRNNRMYILLAGLLLLALICLINIPPMLMSPHP